MYQLIIQYLKFLKFIWCHYKTDFQLLVLIISIELLLQIKVFLVLLLWYNLKILLVKNKKQLQNIIMMFLQIIILVNSGDNIILQLSKLRHVIWNMVEEDICMLIKWQVNVQFLNTILLYKVLSVWDGIWILIVINSYKIETLYLFQLTLIYMVKIWLNKEL